MKTEITLWCNACSCNHAFAPSAAERIIYSFQANLADVLRYYNSTHPLHKEFHGPAAKVAVFCLQMHLDDGNDLEIYREYATSLQDSRRYTQGVTFCEQCHQELPKPEGHHNGQNFEACAEHAPPRDNEMLSRLLSSVASAYAPTPFIATWTDAQYREAETWAALTHLAANDHDDIDVPARPTFLPPAYPADTRDNEAMHAKLLAAGISVPLANIATLDDEAYGAVRFWTHANDCSIFVGDGPLDSPRLLRLALGLSSTP